MIGVVTAAKRSSAKKAKDCVIDVDVVTAEHLFPDSKPSSSLDLPRNIDSSVIGTSSLHKLFLDSHNFCPPRRR